MVHYASLLLACLVGSAAASSIPSDTSLDERSNKQVSADGTLHCGIFGSGNKDTVSDLGLELAAGDLGKQQFYIKAGECQRVRCRDTTGVYVCNVCVSRGPFFAPINIQPSLHPSLSPLFSLPPPPSPLVFTAIPRHVATKRGKRCQTRD